ncbi:alpha/beta fold hydrolase [Dongia sp.]|uniref:bifunctional alpha/beta hydrolase/OsmC family protein n=1 Tax=Dongia sp. TaxID=1977262 RepID=UPI0035B11E0C
MATERFDFRSADGHRLSGRLDLPATAPRAFALFAHCFTCTKQSIAAVRIARALTQRGIGVLRFDFTGLGESEGDFADSTFSGNVRDLVAAAGEMTAKGMAPRLLIGHSLGGAAVLAGAADIDSVAAVAVIGAPFDVKHVTLQFGDHLPDLLEKGEAEVDLGGRPFNMRRAFIDDLERHDQKSRIANLKRALLVLHSPADQTVGADNAGAIFQAARHPKSFVSLDNADHLLTRPSDASYAADVIAAWASRYLASDLDWAGELSENRVVVEETGGGRYQVAVKTGHAQFLADEPREVGGLGSGPTPHQLLAAGLGACTTMTLRMYAERKGWPVAHIRTVVEHAREAGDMAQPDLFTRAVTLTGDLDAEQRARLIEIAGKCPVHKTLTAGARIATVAAEGV